MYIQLAPAFRAPPLPSRTPPRLPLLAPRAPLAPTKPRSPHTPRSPCSTRSSRPSRLSTRQAAELRRNTSVPAMVAAERSRHGHVTAGLVGGTGMPSPKVRVVIEAPARNQRLVSASNLINAPLDTVWSVLTDYDRLSDYIPNLAASVRRAHPRGGIRVEQCGAQSVLGFEFRASLTMDMIEVNAVSDEWRAIEFALVNSRDFRQFQGVWRMESMPDSKTALFYSVSIMPKGIVPVRAIEWRISEDVPGNMDAVREECEKRRRTAVAELRRNRYAGSSGIDS